jgi:spermidine synthase
MLGRKLFGANPRILYTASSSHSGKINVWEKEGSLVLEVGGYPQSISLNTADLPQRYWYKAVEEVGSRLNEPVRALLIGVGGGTILHLLSRKFPKLQMTGVEIDEEILKIARQFFELDKIPNLEIVTGDGGEYVASYQGDPFDFVFLDAYLGGNFPIHFEEEQFLRHLREITNPTGLIVINRTGGFSRSQFGEILGRVFAKVEVVRIPLPGFLGGMGGNYLYLCR